MMEKKKGLFALSPLMVFICIYLVTSIIIQDFYKMPITVAFMLASVYAVAITKGSINKRIEIFSKGAGSKNMMLMIWIFLLAGAFASSAKAMGAVDATVCATLRILPDSLLLPGIFIAACFISLAIGTSVGTIAALTPVAVGIADETGANLPFIVAIVIGGAYFGDNLSFISDTTIVATQTQECKMSDKFKVNSRIVLPVALLMMLIYFFVGMGVSKPSEIPSVDIVRVLPYIAVIVTAVCGLNVLMVLVLGILLTGIIGILNGSYDIFGWFSSVAEGMTNMSELIIMTLMAAGMLAMIRHNGGIDFIISRLTENVSGKRSAEFCISALNTVAIISTGPIANDIATRFGIDKRKSASLLDTTSCFTQGLLPYGAQMLMAAGLASINPISILGYLFYPMALGIAVVVCIVARYPKKYS